MSKNFEAPSNARNVVSIVVVCALVVLILAVKYGPTSSPARMVVGVVQSSGAETFGKIKGGTREIATIRLGNGNAVLALVEFGGPLAPGDEVTLSEQPRMLGPPTYRVIGKKR